MPTPTPTPPTLNPFDPSVTPNLMAGGPYDTVLTQIMEYLGQLKTYLDGQFTTIDGQFATLESDVAELGTELNDLSGSVGAWDKSEHDNASMAEFCGNLTGTYGISLPAKINDGGTTLNYTTSTLFSVSANGERIQGQALANLIGNLMLAAPNGDHTQLFGYLGDNHELLTAVSPAVRSSAALTYAAESGGGVGNVYGVPVDLASDGTATLAVGGSITIHQNETLFVCSSEYSGFTAGTIAEYSGSSSVELSDSAGQNIAAELVAVYVPTGGTAELPEGTAMLKEFGEEGIKQLYIVEGGEQKPVGAVAISDMDVYTRAEFTVYSGVVIGATTKGPDPRATIYAQTQHGEDNISLVSLTISSDDTSGYKQGTIVAFDTTTQPYGEQLTADDIAKARKVNTIAADHDSQIVML